MSEVTMKDTILILLFAHLLTDFVFQNDKMVQQKNSKVTKEKLAAIYLHSLIFLLTAFVLMYLTADCFTDFMVLGLVLLALSHFAIDLVKANLKDKCSDLMLFIVDQISHIVLIILYVNLFYDSNVFIANLELFLNGLLGNKVVFKFNLYQKIIIIACMLISATSVSNILIRFSLKSIRLKLVANIDSNENEVVKIGRYIGSFERILTILSMMIGEYNILIALYGSKTAIRFAEYKENTDFAQYYILGTLISVLLGVVLGIMAKTIL
ncbi:MAG: DUF3307 domain-containing protein [Peptococcaceae bacterium]